MILVVFFSVVGLSFDFLFLNIIGFACYSVYNVFFYFDKNIQVSLISFFLSSLFLNCKLLIIFEKTKLFFINIFKKIYFQRNPHCLIPVLLNDVIFAVHALLICLFTAFQCFIYEVYFIIFILSLFYTLYL